MSRKEIYCDKCKKTHYVRVCDLCGEEFAGGYPDYTMEIYEYAVLNVKVGFEMCWKCKKELVKTCKQLKKVNDKLKKEQEHYKRIVKKCEGKND